MLKEGWLHMDSNSAPKDLVHCVFSCLSQPLLMVLFIQLHFKTWVFIWIHLVLITCCIVWALSTATSGFIFLFFSLLSQKSLMLLVAVLLLMHPVVAFRLPKVWVVLVPYFIHLICLNFLVFVLLCGFYIMFDFSFCSWILGAVWSLWCHWKGGF